MDINRASVSEGFGIVVEGINHTVSNTVKNCESGNFATLKINQIIPEMQTRAMLRINISGEEIHR
ncbi:MAG: hypothetical protein U0T81_09970 [Saprospiraceae bacterium]